MNGDECTRTRKGMYHAMHEAKHFFDSGTTGDSTTSNDYYDCKPHAKYISTTRTKDFNFVRNLSA